MAAGTRTTYHRSTQLAKVPVCDHAERIGQVFDPPQCEEPLQQLQPPLITSVATTRGH